jgi:nicotinamide riboside kinase
MKSPQLICVIGAESTGKTTLTAQLANHFRSGQVSEYLRAFCEEHQRTPARDEQSFILDTQMAMEQQALRHAALQSMPFVICDTGPLLTAVYSDYIFADQQHYDRAVQHHRRYSHTLLLLPDIEWMADGLQRDGEHVRAPITEMIRAQLLNNHFAFTEIAGCDDARLRHAINAIENMRATDADGRDKATTITVPEAIAANIAAQKEQSREGVENRDDASATNAAWASARRRNAQSQ